jgi:nitroreductase
MALRKTTKKIPSTLGINHAVPSADLSPIILPKPKPGRGKTVTAALRQRKTVREFSDKKLSPQILSNLLWAAAGVNRKSGPFGIPGRTSATASNSQEIDLYVALQEGIYFYDPVSLKLVPVVAGDFRALAIGRGQDGFGSNAPVRLIFIADLERLSNTRGYKEPGLKDPDVQKSYCFTDTGLMAGNVYLFAASQGLGAWFHNCDKAGLAAKLQLSSDKRILFGQTVGYPKLS